MIKRIRSVPMVFNHVRFGNDVLTRRLETGMTQADIRFLTGVSDATVSVYEQGKEPRPNMGTFLALCNVFDLDPREYFELER